MVYPMVPTFIPPAWLLDPTWLLGPASGLVISLWYGWAQWNRFERLQAELFSFFRQELVDCHARYDALVDQLLEKPPRE